MRHRVLVVDDYRDAVDATCLLFDRLGHDCRQATSGARALQVAASYSPDIVLLDIGLPDMSGYDVARELRRLYGSSMYLAALTGWGQPEDRLRALAAGFDQHILKPATLRILNDVIAAAERATPPVDGARQT
jgi:DNA-binding response OmpR family regulator